MLKVGSLFSGIGGLELGLEWTGYFETKWQVEIDKYARKVLDKHWPDVPKYGDITKIKGPELEYVDMICGGFPCQDISCAGKGAGIKADRSGLFYEAMRLVREIRPRYVLLENVAALLGRGMGNVLEEIHKSGYDAFWDCIPAQAVGAPHRRDRVFIVAYTASGGRKPRGPKCERQERSTSFIGTGSQVADTGSGKLSGIPDSGRQEISEVGACGRNVPDTHRGRCKQRDKKKRGVSKPDAVRDVTDTTKSGLEGEKSTGSIQRGSKGLSAKCNKSLSDTTGRDGGNRHVWRHWRVREVEGTGKQRTDIRAGAAGHGGREWWDTEPAVCELVNGVSDRLVRYAGRVATKVPNRVNKLRCLGNAVVPQVAQFIGECIKEFDRNNK